MPPPQSILTFKVVYDTFNVDMHVVVPFDLVVLDM